MTRTIEISDENEKQFEQLIECAALERMDVETKMICLMTVGEQRITEEPSEPVECHRNCLTALEIALRERHDMDDVDWDNMLYAAASVALSSPGEVAEELREYS